MPRFLQLLSAVVWTPHAEHSSILRGEGERSGGLGLHYTWNHVSDKHTFPELCFETCERHVSGGACLFPPDSLHLLLNLLFQIWWRISTRLPRMRQTKGNGTPKSQDLTGLVEGTRRFFIICHQTLQKFFFFFFSAVVSMCSL